MREKIDLFSEMEESWDAPGFVRSQVGKVTGSLISAKTLANLHSEGTGPACEIIRGKAFYPSVTFFPWLREWAHGKGGRRVGHQ